MRSRKKILTRYIYRRNRMLFLCRKNKPIFLKHFGEQSVNIYACWWQSVKYMTLIAILPYTLSHNSSSIMEGIIYIQCLPSKKKKTKENKEQIVDLKVILFFKFTPTHFPFIHLIILLLLFIAIPTLHFLYLSKFLKAMKNKKNDEQN